MGIVKKVYGDLLLEEVSANNANRLFVYQTPKDGMGVHIRNFKLILSEPENIAMFKETVLEAREKLVNEHLPRTTERLNGLR